jgi:hypothetical protein
MVWWFEFEKIWFLIIEIKYYRKTLEILELNCSQLKISLIIIKLRVDALGIDSLGWIKIKLNKGRKSKSGRVRVKLILDSWWKLIIRVALRRD